MRIRVASVVGLLLPSLLARSPVARAAGKKVAPAGDSEAIHISQPILPVRDIVKGMKCQGHTVYSGSTLDTFDCEVLGVYKGLWGPGEDVIIVRLVGPNADRYGVVAGMSGSPVTIDGKLIGALSLAMGAFMKEPIAGVTPIEDMVRIGGSHGWPAAGEPAGAKKQSAETDWRPIATPLALSGFSPEIVPLAKELLEPYGFVVSGGGGGGTTGAGTRLVPGGAVSGILVSGDWNISGTGTVTAVEGDRVLAFGHSFLLYGEVEMPMAGADIITTVPSTMLSYKMANLTSVVGAVTRDNREAIAGRLGATARMIPVKVTLPAGTRPREAHFEVFRNKFLTAPMMTVAVMNGLVANADYDAEGTLRLEGHIK